MTTTWTPIPKPSGTAWTKTDVSSKFIYDEPSLTYDMSTVQYDGSGNSWTNVPKPSGTSWTKITKPT